MAENQQFHFAAQARAEPSVVLAIHLKSGYGVRV
jgi:hypothetical protein